MLRNPPGGKGRRRKKPARRPRREKKPGWGAVRTLSNWGYWDQLHGETLRNNDRVDVRFPDGTVLRNRRVTVVKSSEGSSDHGKPITIERVKAYIHVHVHAIKVRVPLTHNALAVRWTGKMDADDWLRS